MPETIGYARPKKIRKSLGKDMEKKLKQASDRLIFGQKFRQQEREDTWRESADQYSALNVYGSYNTDDETADLVNVNISFSTINTLVPFVADEDPTFMVEPDSEEATTENSVVLSTYMNRIWRDHKVMGKLALADSVWDNLVLGDGYLKAGYEIVDLPTYDEAGNPIGEGRVKVAEFSVTRLSPWDVWVDPYSDGIFNARWVCQRIMVPAEEVKNDDRYKITDKDAFEGIGIDQQNMAPEDEERFQNLDGWVTIYEFYDIKNRWMISFFPGASTVIRYVEQITCPIVQVPNYRMPNSPYHIGELEQIRSLQLEINKTRSQMMTHRRRNVMKWVVNEDRLSDDALEAMRSGIVNDVIKVESNEPIESIIQAIVPVPLSQDSYAIDDRMRADVNEITGVNEYLRGVPQNISRTATEASIIEGATNIRTRHKLLQVETAARQVGQVLLDIIRDVLPTTAFEEMTMFISGKEAEQLNRSQGNDPQAGPVILTPNPEVFEGRYRVEVERGSTELRNPQVRAQQLMQMTQMMMGATEVLQQYGIPFNLKKMLEMWFEAEGIKDVEALFEPDEAQEQSAALAQQQREADIAATQAGAAGGGGGVGGPGGPAGTPEGTPNLNAGPPQDLIKVDRIDRGYKVS
jgi:hypothetical protein